MSRIKISKNKRYFLVLSSNNKHMTKVVDFNIIPTVTLTIFIKYKLNKLRLHQFLSGLSSSAADVAGPKPGKRRRVNRSGLATQHHKKDKC